MLIGQLVERYRAKRVWARNRWRLTSCWLRKILSHTMIFYLCQAAGRYSSPLCFSELLAE